MTGNSDSIDPERGGRFSSPSSCFLFCLRGAGLPNKNLWPEIAWRRQRRFMRQVKSNPDVQAYAPAPLYDAQKAMTAAERAEDYQEMEHLSYLAEKKSQMVMAIAEQRKAEKEIGALRKETDQLVLQKRDQEAKLARKRGVAQARLKRSPGSWSGQGKLPFRKLRRLPKPVLRPISLQKRSLSSRLRRPTGE